MDHTTEDRAQIRALARKRVPVQFPIQFDSFNTLLEPIQKLCQVARLVKVECDLAMQDHDSPGIGASIQTLFDLAMVLDRGPGFVSHLVGMAIRGIAYDSLKLAIEQDLLEPPELEFLKTMLETERLELDRFRETIQEERALALPAFFDIQRYSDSQPQANSAAKSPPLRASYQDIEHFLTFMASIEAIETSSMSEALEQGRALYKQLLTNVKGAGPLGFREWVMTGVTCPALDAYLTVCCVEWIQHRLALHGIALRTFEDQEKRFPENLAELQKVGFDTYSFLPVGDKPMGYVFKDDGALLWSTHPSEGMETTGEPPVLGPEQPNNDRRAGLLWDLSRRR